MCRVIKIGVDNDSCKCKSKHISNFNKGDGAMSIKTQASRSWKQIWKSVLEEIENSDLELLLSGKCGKYYGEDRFLDKIDFDEFFDFLLMVLEKAGIEKIESIDDLSEVLRYMHHKNQGTENKRWVHLDEILSEAWTTQPGPGDGCASIAELHLLYLKREVNLTKWVHMKGDVMFLGYSDDIPRNSWNEYQFHRRTHLYPKFKRASNKKYLADIEKIARQLVEIIKSGKLKELRLVLS